MTLQQFADRMNRMTREEIAQAMERSPTDALEWGVRFEALSHRHQPDCSIPCPNCDGAGWEDSGDSVVCSTCNGRMKVTQAEFECWAQEQDRFLREGPIL